MSKGFYHFLREAWKKPDNIRLRELMIEWRAQEAVIKVEKPLRLDKARSLGYKAKKGYVIARIRVLRGGRKRSKINKVRRSKTQTVRKVLNKS